jgi:hypothetical protein
MAFNKRFIGIPIRDGQYACRVPYVMYKTLHIPTYHIPYLGTLDLRHDRTMLLPLAVDTSLRIGIARKSETSAG